MAGNYYTDGECRTGRVLGIEALERSPNDEAVPVRVTGATAGAPVEFEAEEVLDTDL